MSKKWHIDDSEATPTIHAALCYRIPTAPKPRKIRIDKPRIKDQETSVLPNARKGSSGSTPSIHTALCYRIPTASEKCKDQIDTLNPRSSMLSDSDRTRNHARSGDQEWSSSMLSDTDCTRTTAARPRKSDISTTKIAAKVAAHGLQRTRP